MTIERQALERLDGRDLRLLVELDRTGSISRAAERCRMRQPAATKRLQRISASLGTPLVQPVGDGSRELTSAGREVAAHGEAVLDSLDNLERKLRD